MSSITQIKADVAKPSSGLLSSLTSFIDEFKARGIIEVADTTALSAQRGDNTSMVLVDSVGIFQWSASGTPNGTTIFAAADTGVWILKFAGGSGTAPGTLSAPGSFALSSITDVSVTASWAAVTNAQFYIIQRALQSDYSDAITIGKTASTSWVDNGRVAGTHYYYQVKAVATGYNDSSFSTANNTTAADSGYEPLLNAFDAALIADGVTMDSVQKSALSIRIKESKINNTFHKNLVRYPFIGGAANSHKYNLNDPRNADNAFRITWNGTITHSANGVQGNGTTGWGNTHFNSAKLDLDDVRIAIYARGTGDAEDVGAYEGGIGATSFASDFAGPSIRVNDLNFYTPTSVDVLGYVAGSRIRDTEYIYRVGAVVGSTTSTGFNQTLIDWGVLAVNRATGGPADFSSKSIASIEIGRWLTASEEVIEKISEQKYQTSLSRNV